jgi:DNA-binding transcriptional MerR regulator
LDKAPDAFRTISEVAEELDLPQHVLRFWETRFTQIKPMKRGGGRRYYRPDDVDLLRGIRHLLYGEGYTIRGVQRLLREHGGKFVQSVWQAGAAQPPRHPDDEDEAAQAQEADADERWLRAILPSLLGRQPDDGDGGSDEPEPNGGHEPGLGSGEPSHTPRRAPRTPAAVAAAGARLDGDNLRKLQAALSELGECRRLLDAALQDET